MARKTSGPPTEYTSREEGELTAALDLAWRGYGEGVPSDVRITAQIEWAGTLDRKNNGRRTTTLERLNLTEVRAAHNSAYQARAAAEAARPLRSLTAKGWHSQLRELTASRRGYAAADRVGLSASSRTLTRWLAEDATPNKANQEKIARAYELLRNRPVEEARGRATSADHAVAEAMNKAVRDAYGTEVRFRDIGDINLR